MSKWLTKILGIFITLCSLIGIEYKSLATFKSPTSNNNQQDLLIAQSCRFLSPLSSPRPFAEIVTQGNPLNIRSVPNGKVIGKIPNGWQVITLKTDATGQWTYITNQYANWYGGSVRFTSAPNFTRSGWVKTANLKHLGKFCDKPLKLNQGNLLPLKQEQANQLAEQKTVLLNEEWLQLGDRIASNISQK